MSTIPHKIVLKSTTKISLNERFSSIQATRPQNAAPVQQVRAQMAANQQATAKNRRLAQQMANRPTVQAALRLKKKSLAQRLGSNVRSRLTLQGNAVQVRGRGGMRARGGGRGRGNLVRSTSQVSLQSASSMGTGSMISYRGGAGARGQRRGTRIYRGAMRGRGNAARGAFVQGVRGRGGRGARRGIRGAMRGVRGGARGMRGGPRGARRGGRGRGGGPQMSREQLDNQLDEYMTKTKGFLDSELDQYMSGE